LVDSSFSSHGDRIIGGPRRHSAQHSARWLAIRFIWGVGRHHTTAPDRRRFELADAPAHATAIMIGESVVDWIAAG